MKTNAREVPLALAPKRPLLLMIPGIGNSGPDHWQSLWEASDSACVRVQQRDWEYPRCDEWVNTLEAAVSRSGPDTVLVAHSLGCLLVIHWAARTHHQVRSALLVAPPDPDAVAFPREASGFTPLPLGLLPFGSMIVASSDDPYASLTFAKNCAAKWSSRLVEIGTAGHINAASGFGAWPQGLELLSELIGTTSAPAR